MDDREELVDLELATSVVWTRDNWDPDDRGCYSQVVHTNEQAADRVLQSEWLRRKLEEAWDAGFDTRDPRKYIGTRKRLNPHRKATNHDTE